VTGECELATLAPAPAEGEHPLYVTGMLRADGEAVTVVDLGKLISVAAKT
jgi:hypothetical protein